MSNKDVFTFDASKPPKLPYKVKIDGKGFYSSGGYKGTVRYSSKVGLLKRVYYFIVFKIKKILHDHDK